MDLNQVAPKSELTQVSISEESAKKHENLISLETELPEVLYRGMKAFLGENPNWDQYTLMSSALANFLFQNGCEDRAVTERYLNDLFNRLPA